MAYAGRRHRRHLACCAVGNAGGGAGFADRHTRPQRPGAVLRHAADDRAAGDGAGLAAAVRAGKPLPQAVRRGTAARHEKPALLDVRHHPAAGRAIWPAGFPAGAGRPAQAAARTGRGGTRRRRRLVHRARHHRAAADDAVDHGGRGTGLRVLRRQFRHSRLPRHSRQLSGAADAHLSEAGRRWSDRARRGRVPFGADRRDRDGRHYRPGGDEPPPRLPHLFDIAAGRTLRTRRLAGCRPGRHVAADRAGAVPAAVRAGADLIGARLWHRAHRQDDDARQLSFRAVRA